MRNFLILCCLASVTANAQSPWTLKKGGFAAELGYYFLPSYDKVSDVDGNAAILPFKASQATIQFIGELGLTKHTTLALNLPYRNFSTSDFSGSGQPAMAGKLAGLSNVSIALRQAILVKPFQLAATLKVELPTSKFDSASGIRLGYDAISAMPMVSAGVKFKKAYGYGYLGYGFRANGYNRFILSGLEGGFELGKLWLIGFAELNQAVTDGDIELTDANLLTRFFVNHQQYLTFGAKAKLALGKLFGVFGSVTFPAAAKNLPSSPTLGLGAFLKLESDSKH